MALSSSTDGMTMAGRLKTFDIVFYLSTGGAAQADDSSNFSAIYKCHVVQDIGFWSKGDHSQFTVLVPFINPNQRGVPIERLCQRKGNAVLFMIAGIFA
jgi:hypothetical protein